MTGLRNLPRRCRRLKALPSAAPVLLCLLLAACATTARAPSGSPPKRSALDRVLAQTRRAEHETKLKTDYVNAVNAYLKGDDARAARLARYVIKEHGPVGAEYLLGLLYCRGQAVKRDCATGLAWIERAAVGGSTLAQADLAWRYYEGKGLPRDRVMARRWAEPAARRGNVTARRVLCALESPGQSALRCAQPPTANNGTPSP